MKKYIKYSLVVLSLGIGFSSCSDRKPDRVYMPDMYYSPAYEPYAETKEAYAEYTGRESDSLPIFMKNGMSQALTPPQGTVPRTQDSILPHDLPDTNEGYAASKALTSPLKEDMKYTLERGAKLYGQTCTACHGDKGDGQGSIVQTGAYGGVPNYKDREITVGSVYHVIMYGKNAMGSYASQLQEADRWRVAQYVMQLRNEQ